jgi:hypothetical protein
MQNDDRQDQTSLYRGFTSDEMSKFAGCLLPHEVLDGYHIYDRVEVWKEQGPPDIPYGARAVRLHSSWPSKWRWVSFEERPLDLRHDCARGMGLLTILCVVMDVYGLLGRSRWWQLGFLLDRFWNTHPKRANIPVGYNCIFGCSTLFVDDEGRNHGKVRRDAGLDNTVQNLCRASKFWWCLLGWKVCSCCLQERRNFFFSARVVKEWFSCRWCHERIGCAHQAGFSPLRSQINIAVRMPKCHGHPECGECLLGNTLAYFEGTFVREWPVGITIDAANSSSSESTTSRPTHDESQTDIVQELSYEEWAEQMHPGRLAEEELELGRAIERAVELSGPPRVSVWDWEPAANSGASSSSGLNTTAQAWRPAADQTRDYQMPDLLPPRDAHPLPSPCTPDDLL